jgi:hypothetical protein
MRPVASHKRSKPKPRKRKPAPKKAPPKKRKPAPKKRKPTAKQRRAAAAKKGWATRRKKQRLLEAMADLQMQRQTEAQPLGWIERREKLRLADDKWWRQISVTYDQKVVDARRLETLRELEIDLATRDELYDYLSWTAKQIDVDIADMYEMYLGYRTGQESMVGEQ